MKIKGPAQPINLLAYRQEHRLIMAGKYQALPPNRVRFFAALDLYKEKLDQFPSGQEFYGTVVKAQEDAHRLWLTVRPTIGQELLISQERLSFNLTDRFGEPLLNQLFLESGHPAPNGLLELTLEKAGNLTGIELAPEAGSGLTSNQHSLPFRRKIRAAYDQDTITVYQSFNPIIAAEAVKRQHFGPHFQRDRATWIKPSFLWTMKRSSWNSLPGQERTLAISLKRSAFEQLLAQACLTQPTIGLSYGSVKEYTTEASRLKNRVQWDPERDIRGNKLPQRSLQLGVQTENLPVYLDGIEQIEDITDQAVEIRMALQNGRPYQANLPAEFSYPTPLEQLRRLEMHQYYSDENSGLVQGQL